MGKIHFKVKQKRNRHSHTKNTPKCHRCRKFISRGLLCGGCKAFVEHMAKFSAKFPVSSKGVSDAP